MGTIASSYEQTRRNTERLPDGTPLEYTLRTTLWQLRDGRALWWAMTGVCSVSRTGSRICSSKMFGCGNEPSKTTGT